MRLQSDIQVRVKNTVIGGPDFLICISLLATERSDLFREAAVIKQSDPDLLEWRIDGYRHVQDISGCLDALAELRIQFSGTPLIFTCRSHSEGGLKKLTRDQRHRLLTEVMASGNLDIVDIELCNDADFIQSIMEIAGNSSVRVILSYHDFKMTPDESFIFDTLLKARDLGADIAKVAVMSKGYHDVLTLLSATLKARQQGLKIPAITMSMGSQGRLTRLAGGLFGSDITFAGAVTPAAPGQMPVEILRQAMASFYS